MAGGVSDGSWMSKIGIPTVDGLGPVGALDHTDEEYIEIASIDPRIESDGAPVPRARPARRSSWTGAGNVADRKMSAA